MLSSLPLTSNLPAPTPGPVSAGSANNGSTGTGDGKPASFSRALDDASSPEPERTPPQGRQAGPTKARSTGEGAQKPAGRAAGPHGAAPAAAPDAADDTPTGAGCLAPAADTEAAEPAAPAEICTLLADLQARAPATLAAPHPATGTTKAALAGATEADTGKGKALAVDTLRGATHNRQIDLPTLPADRRGGPAAPSRPEPALNAEPQAAAPTTATERLAATAASLHSEAALPVAPAPTPQALAAQAGAGTVRPAEVAEAAIAAHPASAEFAPQLGASVATFVRNGVEHARLQLHPAELGPVQVQIQLEGNNAQVMLGAEHPLTRQALEQSLPMLAATLREAGLTLAGGGVFEQTRQGSGNAAGEGRSDGGNSGRGAGSNTGDGAAPPVRAQQPRSRGVVDLVA